MPEIITLGDLNLDILFYLNRLPSKGGESLAPTLEVHPGGSAANVAVALSRLGLNVGFIGAVGNDVIGEFLLRNMESENVDVSLLARKKDYTGVMVIIVTRDGERTILGYRGANRLLSEKDVEEEYFKTIKYAFVSGYALLENPQKKAAYKMMKIAREKGAKIFVDICEVLAGRTWSNLKKLLLLSDYLLMNEREFEMFIVDEKNISSIFEYGVEAIIVKRGGKGARTFTKQGVCDMPAFRVEAVDTTGAGDAFDAGFIYGIFKKYDMRRSLEIANALAAWKCKGRGARHLPKLKQLNNFLKKYSACKA